MAFRERGVPSPGGYDAIDAVNASVDAPDLSHERASSCLADSYYFEWHHQYFMQQFQNGQRFSNLAYKRYQQCKIFKIRRMIDSPSSVRAFSASSAAHGCSIVSISPPLNFAIFE